MTSFFLALFSILTGAASEAREDTHYIAIGTSNIAGIYYPLGGAIAEVINRSRSQLGIRARVEATAGSVYNTRSLIAGDLDLGIVQSDRQYNAVHGLASWKKRGRQSKLRSLFSLHPEFITLVVRRNSDIESIDDLRGKRVSIGNPGSGTRANALEVLEAAGVERAEVHIESLSPSVAPKRLEQGLIDAYFFTVGHPISSDDSHSILSRDVRWVPLSNVGALLSRNPLYFKKTALTPGGAPQVGCAATMMATSDLSDEIAYQLTRYVFEHLDEIKAVSPAMAKLDRTKMLDHLSAPLHAGAKRYFSEIGLLSKSRPSKSSPR